MLLPALNSARNKAREALCMGNMKQIGTAIANYVGDSDDMLPPVWNASNQYFRDYFHRYLGIAEYETAQKYLSAFSADETVLSPAVTAAIGNCLVDMEKYAESAKYFEKAAKVSDNAVFSPIYLKKAAAAYEKVGNNEAAVKLYQEIKDKYPTSNDARGIERYIERAQNK